MNSFICTGNLVRDPEPSTTSSNKIYTKFDIAINDYYNCQTSVLYMKLVCWNKQAEFVCNYVKKGDGLVIQGRLVNNEYTAKNGEKRSGLELLASTVEKINTKKEKEFTYEPQDNVSYNDVMKNQTSQLADIADVVGDDDIPF